MIKHMKKIMDHNEYPESLKSKTHAELHFIANDAKAAMEANPEGENAGYYADEVNYVCNELHRRRNNI